MTFEEWLFLTTGKTFDEYFNDYPHGIYHFEIHLIDLKMTFTTYCKENDIQIEN